MATIIAPDELMLAHRRARKIKSLIRDMENQLKPLEQNIRNFMAESGIDTIVDNDGLSIFRSQHITGVRFNTTLYKMEHADWKDSKYAEEYCIDKLLYN